MCCVLIAVFGYALFASRCLMLDVFPMLFIGRGLLRVVWCFGVCCVLLVVCCALCVAGWSLFVVRCVSLVVRCLVFVVY